MSLRASAATLACADVVFGRAVEIDTGRAALYDDVDASPVHHLAEDDDSPPSLRREKVKPLSRSGSRRSSFHVEASGGRGP